jgi:hypothetical protein
VSDREGVMSLIPEFELGLWNAWILILSFLLSFIVLGVPSGLRGQKGSSRPMTPHACISQNLIISVRQL